MKAACATIILIIALAGAPFATQVESVSAISNIDLTGTNRVTMIIELKDGQNQPFTINRSALLYHLDAYDETGNRLQPTLEVANGSSSIGVTVPRKYLRLEMQTAYLTTKVGNIWTYNSTIAMEQDVGIFDSLVNLPAGSVIQNTNGIVQEGDSGLAVHWHYEDVPGGRKINRHIIYGLTNAGESQNDWQWYLLAAALLVVAGAAYFRLKGTRAAEKGAARKENHDGIGKRSRNALEANSTFSTLEETDKEIIREIHSQDGKTTQAHVYLRTHIPKGTLSRHLTSLENRGLIKRSQKGIRKLVSLTDVFS